MRAEQEEQLNSFKIVIIAGYLGNSCLHMAAENVQYDVMKFFLSRGMSPNITNKLTETPLHLVAGKHYRGQCFSLVFDS